MSKDTKLLLQTFLDYAESVRRHSSSKAEQATQVIEEQSQAHPDRMNCMVEASSFDACQALIMDIMETEGTATFTIPARAANGSYMAVGHYQKREQLPEL